MQRDFKGIWIPKELWILKDLSLLEKVMLIEIDSLDNENGCYASNDYFADFFGLNKGRISKVINSLVKRGFVTSELKYQKGTQLVEKRILKISRWYKAKNKITSSQKQLEGMEENDQGYSQSRPRSIVENDQENKLNFSSQIFGAEPAQAIRAQNISKNESYTPAKKSVSDACHLKPDYSQDSDPYLLAKFLERCIVENNPRFPQNESQRQVESLDTQVAYKAFICFLLDLLAI